jgi:AcrR family transcriptional regulator
MVAVVTVEQQPADSQPAVGMRRPGGRTARVRSAVHTAVADLVTEQPWGDLNIPMIAQRSGVHQATIYRRWGTISGLLNDVVAEQLARMAPIPDTGSLRGDLERYAAEAAGHVAGPLGALVLRTAMSELETGPRAADDPAVAARRRRFQPMLDRAAARGEHPPCVADLEELLLAPLYFHALFSAPLQPRDTRRLVDRLLTLPDRRQPH